MQSLPLALAPLAAYRQFVPYRLVPSARPGKTDKLPLDWRTGRTPPKGSGGHISPEFQCSFVEAAEAVELLRRRHGTISRVIGVLEPLQANPTIIEDNCFIGARSEVVEGVIVEENSVISMGVYLGQSTPIYDRATGEISYGRVPAGSVVISGSLPKEGGKYSMYAAIIVKKVDAKTRSTTSLNDLLRD
mgnify:CR=1 FL=1